MLSGPWLRVGFGTGQLATMLNVAYRNSCETEFCVGIESISAGNLQLIVPNLHRRYSGVTATNRMVAPKLANMFAPPWFGPDAPDGIARMGAAELLNLWRPRAPRHSHAPPPHPVPPRLRPPPPCRPLNP